MIHRDIRSSSVPQLRLASKRVKYGGLPPTDAFDIDNSEILWKPRLGKPTTHLTPSQKHRVARNSAAPLIGKHVNRNNQRTGERDPWNHYGPGKRWAKQEARGKDVDTTTGIDIWSGQKDEDEWLEPLLESYEEGAEQGACPAALRLDELCRSKTMESTQESDNGEPIEIETGNEQINHHTSQLEQAWEFVESLQGYGETDFDDDWDVLSLSSASCPLVSIVNSTMGAFSGVNRVACAKFYGVQKSSRDCLAAIRQMPSGDTPIIYNFNGYDRATRLPQYYQSGVFPLPSSRMTSGFLLSKPVRQTGQHVTDVFKRTGDCMIQIELAGPQLPLTIDLIPNELKSMAAGVLETCTKKPRYVGGFLAGDLGPIRQWISSEPGDLDKPFRSYSSLHLPLVVISK
ncbi:MAG: hypothetical protein Q9203_007588, partial [Teloschistes exilis]